MMTQKQWLANGLIALSMVFGRTPILQAGPHHVSHPSGAQGTVARRTEGYGGHRIHDQGQRAVVSHRRYGSGTYDRLQARRMMVVGNSGAIYYFNGYENSNCQNYSYTDECDRSQFDNSVE